MKLQKVLTTAVLGVGLGAFTLPGIALANVNAYPGVAPVGTTITLTARCKPSAKGPRPSATFHVTGPRKEHRAGPGADSDRGPEGARSPRPEKHHGTGGGVDISVESTGTEAKVPDTVSAQVPTNNWQPGEYDVKAKCSDGTVAGQTAFTLTPQGGPHGGEGGPAGNGTLVAAGTAMLGAGAIGFVLLRRQRPGAVTG